MPCCSRCATQFIHHPTNTILYVRYVLLFLRECDFDEQPIAWAPPFIKWTNYVCCSSTNLQQISFEAAIFLQAFARSLALNPRQPIRGPIFPESLSDFKASFHLFHGATGVVPLVRCDQPAFQFTTQDAPVGQGCSSRQQASPKQCAAAGVDAEVGSPGAAPTPVSSRARGGSDLLGAAPFASLSTRIFRFLVSSMTSRHLLKMHPCV
jgi:hypothetical protein